MDRVIASDPGLLRLLSALQAVVTIGAAMLAEGVFVRLTHALQIDSHGAVPPQAQAAVAAQHHGVLVIAILLGAIIGMIASFASAMFPTPKAQVVAYALLPVPMVAGLSLGLAVAPYRALALVSFVVVLAGGAYCRRFGAPGFVGGMLLFQGDFFGFFLRPEVSLSDIGWLSAEIAIGAFIAIAAQFTLFFPSRRAAVRRMLRTYGVRARQLSTRALDLFDARGDRAFAERSLHRRLVRLNETALMVDAHLGDPQAIPAGWSAPALHQALFDSELALTNMARFADRLSRLPLPEGIRESVRAALAAVARMELLAADLAGHELLARLRTLPMDDTDDFAADPGQLDRTSYVVIHRFAISVLGFTEASQTWRQALSVPATDDGSTPVEPSVLLFGGWLPGSTMVSAAASLEARSAANDRAGLRDRMRRWNHIGLAPYTRVAIQMAVAATGAIVLGDVLSGRRFYWAVIAAFVTFMGTNNAAEQLRKGFHRVAGTVAGALLGAILAHLVGGRTDLAIAVILISLFFGLYLVRISYAFMVVGITVMVSQLYVQLDEFSNSLLVLRLEETALGAGFTALTVLCVLPLHARRVTRVATRHYVQAVANLADLAVQRMLAPSDDVGLRAAARRLDAAYHAVVATIMPSRLPLPGMGNAVRDQVLHAMTASRHYARNLLADTTAEADLLPPQVSKELRTAARQLAASLDELSADLREGGSSRRTYVRAASLFDLAATRLESHYTSPQQLALRDLQLLDGAMAIFAQSLHFDLRALDTAATLSTR